VTIVATAPPAANGGKVEEVRGEIRLRLMEDISPDIAAKAFAPRSLELLGCCGLTAIASRTHSTMHLMSRDVAQAANSL
jgi:hypothetical protein